MESKGSRENWRCCLSWILARLLSTIAQFHRIFLPSKNAWERQNAPGFPYMFCKHGDITYNSGVGNMQRKIDKLPHGSILEYNGNKRETAEEDGETVLAADNRLLFMAQCCGAGGGESGICNNHEIETTAAYRRSAGGMFRQVTRKRISLRGIARNRRGPRIR